MSGGRRDDEQPGERAATAARPRRRAGGASRTAGYLLESLLWKVGLDRVAGADEVGVGPLAGAVVAAAVVFPPGVTVQGLADSKRLSPAAREALDAEIRGRAEIAIAAVEVDEIDRINIYQARMEALRRAVGALPGPLDIVLVDGREVPRLPYRQSAYVKGDGFVASIAAASIVAKVHRDAYMRDLDARYPEYGFARNMGYGTRAHLEALRRFGPSPVHRRSFHPQALRQESLFAATR